MTDTKFYNNAVAIGVLSILISSLLFYLGLLNSGFLGKIFICLSGAIFGCGIFLLFYVLSDLNYLKGEQQ